MRKHYCTITLFLIILAPCLVAHESEKKTPSPGYRPETEYAEAFLRSVGTSHMIVHPTVVRIKTNDDLITKCDKGSQEVIRRHLIEHKIADPNGFTTEIDLSRAQEQGQFGLFQNRVELIGKQISQTYHVAAETIIIQNPENRLTVFGIHLYILDRDGHNAFSFLLNSHHTLFVDARLHAENNSTESIEKLVAESIQVALQALDQQIQNEK
jgi:hypothetical protein